MAEPLPFIHMLYMYMYIHYTQTRYCTCTCTCVLYVQKYTINVILPPSQLYTHIYTCHLQLLNKYEDKKEIHAYIMK